MTAEGSRCVGYCRGRMVRKWKQHWSKWEEESGPVVELCGDRGGPCSPGAGLKSVPL